MGRKKGQSHKHNTLDWFYFSFYYHYYYCCCFYHTYTTKVVSQNFRPVKISIPVILCVVSVCLCVCVYNRIISLWWLPIIIKLWLSKSKKKFDHQKWRLIIIQPIRPSWLSFFFASFFIFVYFFLEPRSWIQSKLE